MKYEMMYEEIARNELYRPVFNKYGITTHFGRTCWMMRDDSEQIRKDLRNAIHEWFESLPKVEPVGEHHHEEDE